MTYFKQQVENSTSSFLSDDTKHANSIPFIANIAIWTSVEQSLAITAGSLATLRPLIRKVGRKLGLASGTTGSTYDIEHGPRGPPVLLKEGANSMFSRQGQPGSRGSDAVLLETHTAMELEGAHVSLGRICKKNMEITCGTRLTRVLASSIPNTCSSREPSTKPRHLKEINHSRIPHLHGRCRRSSSAHCV